MLPEFNYEQSIWGQGEASLSWFGPTKNRLKQSLRALEVLPTGAKVLEVGCGAGQFIRAIANIRPELDCYGCDISQRAIEKAIANLAQGRAKVRYGLSKPESLHYADNFFQAIVIFDVLEHAADLPALLREINRVLEPGGLFYCYAPCEGDRLSLWRWLRKLNIIKTDLTAKYAGHINKFSCCQLRELAREHNFVIIGERYGEHFLGQMLGLAVFMLMDFFSKKSIVGRQINNEQFLAGINRRGGYFFNLFKKIVNCAVSLENFFLSRLPSPNIHLFMRKAK